MPTLMKSRMSYEVYAHSEQNTRRKMEDKHIVMTEVNNFFGLDKVMLIVLLFVGICTFIK